MRLFSKLEPQTSALLRCAAVRSRSMASGAKMPTVLVTRTLPPRAMQRLEEAKGIRLIKWEKDEPIPRSELIAKAKGVDGILCLLTEKIDDALLDAAGPSLRVVSSMSVGYDHIDVPACRRRNVTVGNTPGVLTEATADIAVLLALMAARHALPAAASVRAGGWGTWSPLWMCGMDVAGSTVGVVGFGRIGAAVARRMSAFGARRVLYCGSGGPKQEAVEAGAVHVTMEELLRESDFVFATCALTEKTKGLFNAPAFAAMKRSAVFVNTSRGGVVNQDDLVSALRDRRIYAAGLDVTTPEPLPTDHPLLSLDNCVVLPHIGSATVNTREAMAAIAVDNVLAGIEGRPLRHAV